MYDARNHKTETNRLIQLGEITAIPYETHKKYINTICGQQADKKYQFFWDVTPRQWIIGSRRY
jgi:hypothetical protein